MSNGKGSLGHWHLLQLKSTLVEQGCCHAVPNQFQVFDITVMHCIVDKTRDFPSLKIDANKWLFWEPLTTRACRRSAGLMDTLTGIRDFYHYLLIVHSQFALIICSLFAHKCKILLMLSLSVICTRSCWCYLYQLFVQYPVDTIFISYLCKYRYLLWLLSPYPQLPLWVLLSLLWYLLYHPMSELGSLAPVLVYMYIWLFSLYYM